MDIHKICIEYKITDYTINEDGSIDVNNNVDLGFYKLTDNYCDTEIGGDFYTSLRQDGLEIKYTRC